jgi:hypothetical protein
MMNDDEEAVALLSAAYHDFVLGKGGRPPQSLLQQADTDQKRNMLLKEMTTIDLLFALAGRAGPQG